MDIDTDADNQNDDDQDQDDNDDEEDEPDGLNTVEDNDDDTDARHHYVGLATGWSEEEDESSFDADLFFANLSDSSSTSTSSTRRRSHSYTPGGIDADQSSSTSESPTRSTLESLPFEVTENWDGQLIFTNGESESRGIVDINFEKDTERFITNTDDDDDTCSFFSDHLNYDPRSTTQLPESSDIDMFSISDADAGYEEDDGGADEGDTTDEELVGDDCLPNKRAMRLFTLPMPMPLGMSAINPMSTVSPSIGLEKRRHTWRGIDGDGDQEERKRWRRRSRPGTGPRAADILAGKVVFWGDGGGYASSSSASSDSIIKISKGKGKGKGKGKRRAFFSPSPSPPSSSHADYQRPRQISSTPRTGVFIPTGKTRQAVIGDDKKGADVPSPHPRFNGKRSRVSVVCCFVFCLLHPFILSSSFRNPFISLHVYSRGAIFIYRSSTYSKNTWNNPNLLSFLLLLSPQIALHHPPRLLHSIIFYHRQLLRLLRLLRILLLPTQTNMVLGEAHPVLQKPKWIRLV